jgi:hypothetical protein
LAGGINLYAYAGNNPVSFDDPYGLCPWCIGAALGAAVAGTVHVAANFVQGRPVTENLGRSLLVGAIVGGTLGAAAPEATLAFGARVTAGSTAAVTATGAGAAEAGTGGRHAGYVAEMAKRAPEEIARAVRSLERVAAQHADWLSNPTSKVPDFYQRSAAEQASLLRQWGQTVADRTEQAGLLKELLK